MKINLTIIIFILCLCASLGYGQSFVGIVLDKETNQPISLADIFFVDLHTGTLTDDNGIFTIDHFDQNKLLIQISIIGYESINKVIDLEKTKKETFYLQPGHFELEEVVVSVPSARLQSENVVNVDRKRLKALHQTSSVSLAEAISNIPGVDQNTTGVGIGKPVIRGLSGNRIVTYAQGIRIENQQWGEEHGLGVGAIGIESIEVIKGPASLLYGSDALGGVLYFVDDSYTYHNTIEGFVQSNFKSNTIGNTTDVGLKIHKEEFKFNLFGAYSSHADYKVPELGRVDNTRFDEMNIKTSFGFNTRNWVSNIRYSYLKNNFGISEDETYSDSKERDFVLPFQTIDNQILSFENLYYLKNSKLSLTFGHTNNYRREFEDDRNDQALGMKLKTTTYNLSWKTSNPDNKFNIIIGSQGMFQSNKNNGEEILIPDAETTDFGGFSVLSLDLDNIQFQGGIRYDNRRIETKLTESIEAIDQKYNGFTYSAGSVFSFDRVLWRTNISSGFRAPNTSELLSKGIHEGTNRFERGDINLKQEKATQIDMSIGYQDEHFSIAISPFHNSIRDYIFLSPTGMTIDNSPVYEYRQSKATLFGGEIGIHYHPHRIHWLHMESSLSTVRAEDDDNNPLPLIPQTKINSTISAELLSQGKFQIKNIFVQHIYKFEQDRVGIFETSTGSYNLVNIGMNAVIKGNNQPLEINTGINNLFNTQYIDHLSRFKEVGLLNMGINFYLGVKYAFSKKIDG